MILAKITSWGPQTTTVEQSRGLTTPLQERQTRPPCRPQESNKTNCKNSRSSSVDGVLISTILITYLGMFWCKSIWDRTQGRPE